MQDEPSSATAVELLQEWNNPRINLYRVFATFYSFFIFGMNDGAYGVSYATIRTIHLQILITLDRR